MLKIAKIHRERVKRADKIVENRKLFEIVNFNEKSRNLHAKNSKDAPQIRPNHRKSMKS